MLNETGTLIVANRDFYDLTGYDAEDAPELSLTDIWPDAQKVLSSVSGVRGEWRGEAHISRGDGSAVPLSLSATSAMRAHGVPDGFVIKIGALSDETGPV
jgi:PAS domain S-box-containing protein